MTKSISRKAFMEEKVKNIGLNISKKELLDDYKLANTSRQLSVLARKEVLTGKAKFGIFGDGKEIAQIALAKFFRDGDWRSGYYRDQTFVLAAGICSPEEFFAQIYGNTDTDLNPHTSGRSFNNHFATRSLNNDGSWKDIAKMKNSSSDISPTAGQMPRLVGLAYASKLYRQNTELHGYNQFSSKGNEVAFGAIGDSSTAEGHFFEAMNAAGVLQIPMATAVWDDGYGISVTVDHQIIKASISETLKGFEKGKSTNGILIYKAKGWDYPSMIKMFKEGIEKCRKKHVPVLFHVTEITQPLGHSTSGSHERYKPKERLLWEKEHDGITKMRQWLIDEGIALPEELDTIETESLDRAKAARNHAWEQYTRPLKEERDQIVQIIESRQCVCSVNGKKQRIDSEIQHLKSIQHPIRKDNFSSAKKILRHVCLDCRMKGDLQDKLKLWLKNNTEKNYRRYSSLLYNESSSSALKIKAVPPMYGNQPSSVPGREILRDNFSVLFEKEPRLVAFGEDVGKIGGVNQSFEGLQKKFGELRITDTGIREATIIGQGIGLALRGLRPIAEIQYLDYLLYGIQTLSDDLATLHYRTKGGQVAPLIIRTRGHRFEGIWHAGSPMGMILGAIRGIYVCTPRNMTQAAGFYNTLLEAEDPAIVIEPLIGYRLRENKPQNIGEYKVPLGVPEILTEGKDITLVTYGSCVRIALEAVEQLKEFDISVEVIDVQTLIPFDIPGTILKSIQKTNRVLFFDEDVPGGGSGYMMKKVLEDQQAYYYLDSEPKTLSANEHRPAYGTDGDYFSNPNAENVFETIYAIMHEADPEKYSE